VTNRGHDSIAVCSIDAKTGKLTPAGHVPSLGKIPSLGKTPRNITIDPTNAYLITANQAGENVVVPGSQQPVAQAAAVAFVKTP
jgi:6-phosphogluconolactonase